MSNFEDFIYMDDEALPEQTCEEITKFVKEHKQKFIQLSVKHTAFEPQREKTKQDDMWFYVQWFNTFPNNHYDLISEIIKKGIGEYLQKYSVTFDYLSLSSPKIKYHIVHPHGGYHTWHSEWSGGDRTDSMLVWHLSLTSHKEEGELEFLYYGKRIEPKAGRLIMWPSYFTHTHKGNPIRTNTEKHYMTGWWNVIDFGNEKRRS